MDNDFWGDNGEPTWLAGLGRERVKDESVPASTDEGGDGSSGGLETSERVLAERKRTKEEVRGIVESVVVSAVQEYGDNGHEDIKGSSFLLRNHIPGKHHIDQVNWRNDPEKLSDYGSYSSFESTGRTTVSFCELTDDVLKKNKAWADQIGLGKVRDNMTSVLINMKAVGFDRGVSGIARDGIFRVAVVLTNTEAVKLKSLIESHPEAVYDFVYGVSGGSVMCGGKKSGGENMLTGKTVDVMTWKPNLKDGDYQLESGVQSHEIPEAYRATDRSGSKDFFHRIRREDGEPDGDKKVNETNLVLGGSELGKNTVLGGGGGSDGEPEPAAPPDEPEKVLTVQELERSRGYDTIFNWLRVLRIPSDEDIIKANIASDNDSTKRMVEGWTKLKDKMPWATIEKQLVLGGMDKRGQIKRASDLRARLISWVEKDEGDTSELRALGVNLDKIRKEDRVYREQIEKLKSGGDCPVDLRGCLDEFLQGRFVDKDKHAEFKKWLVKRGFDYQALESGIRWRKSFAGDVERVQNTPERNGDKNAPEIGSPKFVETKFVIGGKEVGVSVGMDRELDESELAGLKTSILLVRFANDKYRQTGLYAGMVNDLQDAGINVESLVR
jgi:hypothetical protein